MPRKQLSLGWIAYLVLFGWAFFAHACAVESDLQVAPATASARQV